MVLSYLLVLFRLLGTAFNHVSLTNGVDLARNNMKTTYPTPSSLLGVVVPCDRWGWRMHYLHVISIDVYLSIFKFRAVIFPVTGYGIIYIYNRIPASTF